MNLYKLQTTYAQTGIVVSIAVRPKPILPVEIVVDVLAIEGKGLAGDRYKKAGGSRQVTLIQFEHLRSIASFLGKSSSIDFTLTRRNILVKGINLLSLEGKTFKVGDAILQHSGECHPCSRMETNLGAGGYNAMTGHGGITARVLSSGLVRVNDHISVLEVVKPVQ